MDEPDCSACPITLFHWPGSRSSRVLWLLYELKEHYSELDFQLHTFSADFRTNKPQWFLNMNPNGKVPFLVDNLQKVRMFDGCAICLYLWETYDVDGRLGSKTDPQFRSKLFEMAFYISGTVDNLTALSSPVQQAVMKFSWQFI